MYSNEQIIGKIEKQFKKDELFLYIYLENYEGYNIYIRIDFIKKTKCFRLSWYDLDEIKESDLTRYYNCEFISEETIERFKTIFSQIIYNKTEFFAKDKNDGKVTIHAATPTPYSDFFHATFNKFIPKSLSQLSEIIITIFNSLPRKLENFLYELHGELTGTKQRYEYKNKFQFDLFNGDIDTIFAYQIIERGKKYDEEEKVTYLEKIDDTRYFAIVNGTRKYVVVISYEENKKELQVYCSCPCEFHCKHICAVILAIRKNKFKRFYKIAYRNPNSNLLERLLNFEYSLCLGFVENNLEIINNNGEIELVPILDEENQNHWEVLEDDEYEMLAKHIQKVFRGE